MNDNVKVVLDTTTQNINSLMNENLGQISEKSTKYIQEVENLKIDAKNRFDSFYGRKKTIDYLVYANLGLTPIILVILIFFTFFK